MNERQMTLDDAIKSLSTKLDILRNLRDDKERLRNLIAKINDIENPLINAIDEVDGETISLNYYSGIATDAILDSLEKELEVIEESIIKEVNK